jgi:hypothetical protein
MPAWYLDANGLRSSADAPVSQASTASGCPGRSSCSTDKGLHAAPSHTTRGEFERQWLRSSTAERYKLLHACGCQQLAEMWRVEVPCTLLGEAIIALELGCCEAAQAELQQPRPARPVMQHEQTGLESVACTARSWDGCRADRRQLEEAMFAMDTLEAFTRAWDQGGDRGACVSG